METTVLMVRNLLGSSIRQNSKNGMLCVNDLIAAANKYRVINGLPMFNINSWLATQSTKEFIASLENQFGKVIEAKRGNKGTTFYHPYLFIDLALAIDPSLKIEVYSWLYDELLKYRNFSGDSYKKMCGAIWERTQSKSTFPRDISKLADLIRIECDVKDWQNATEEQLRLRDRIHENIALLVEVMNNINQAIRLGIQKAKA